MKMTPDEICKELKEYKFVKFKKDIKNIPLWSSIKYIDKKKKEYRRGGLLFAKKISNGYIILQSQASKKGKPIRWSIQLKDVILFVKKK